MDSKIPDGSITIRATRPSYFLLGVIWTVVAVACVILGIKSPFQDYEVIMVITAGFAIVWWIWLLRIKLTVSERYLEYRDGIFKPSKIALRLIAEVKDENIEWDARVLNRIPRVNIMDKNGDIAMMINTTFFNRNDLERVLQTVKTRMR